MFVKSQFILRLHLSLAAACLLAVSLPLSAQTVADRQPTALRARQDVIRRDDALTITVIGQPSLTGTYSVDADGAVRIPLIGSVPAADLTVAGLAERLRQRLNGYLRDPDVRVTLDRPAEVFVLGEVKAPGTFPLTESLTVVELLAKAGHTTGGEVLLVRTPGARGPMMPDHAEPSNVIRINLRELEKDAETGDLSRNVALAANDTVFVPKLDPTLVYVVGQVRNPGAHSVADGTTVLQIVTLAGGPTDDAALNRIRVTRWTEGADRGRRVRLTDAVHPGDSIAVPEAFQIPSVISVAPIQPDTPRQSPFRIPLGPYMALRPSLTVWRLGVDTNVFNSGGKPQASFVATFGPELGVTLKTSHLQVDASGRLALSAYPSQTSENSSEPGYGIAPSLTVTPRLTLRSQWNLSRSRERWSNELDLRARRREETFGAGITVRPFARIGLDVDGRDWKVRFDPNQTVSGVDLQQTLTERVRSLKGTLHLTVTALSDLTVSAVAASHRFPLLRSRDANATEITAGVAFKPTAMVTGQVEIGRLRYVPVDTAVPPFDGMAGHFALSRAFRDRTAVGVRAQRAAGASFQPQFPFAIIDQAGGWVQQMLSRRFDVLGEVYHERFSNRFVAPLTGEVQWSNTDTRRYTSQFGVRVGRTRVAANATYVERLYPAGYHNLLLWADVSYGIFQARNQ